MSTARIMSDGGNPTGLLSTLSMFGIITGLCLWVGLFLVIGVVESAIVVDGLLIGTWVLLPISVGTHGVVNPRCSKQRAVQYALGSAFPVFGAIPASVYLGLTQRQ